MRKDYPFLVRRGRTSILDDDGYEWHSVVVATHHDADNVTRYLVVLTDDARYSRVVQHFDVHDGRYASDKEETSVTLSAVGHACSTAAHLDSLAAWQLAAHLPSITREQKQ